MDPRRSAQDVLRCHLCKTPVPTMYCDFCKLHFCKSCVGEHLSDESTEHRVVPFKTRGSPIYCANHSTKLCELYCKQCDVPICLQCVSSNEHLGHKQADILKGKNEALQRDLKELENSIYPKYQEIAFSISVQKADLRKKSHNLKSTLDKQGENLHREIENVIKKLKNDVDEIESTNLVVIDKQEDEIACSMSVITQIIADVKKLLNSNDVSLVSSYKPSFAKFRMLPSKLKIGLPSLSPQKINKQQIYQQFGSLSAVGITAEDCTSSSRKLPSASRPKKTQLKEEEEMYLSSVQQMQRKPQRHNDQIYQNPYPNHRKKFNRHSKEDDSQWFESMKCSQTIASLDMDNLQVHLLEEGFDTYYP